MLNVTKIDFGFRSKCPALNFLSNIYVYFGGVLLDQVLFFGELGKTILYINLKYD